MKTAFANAFSAATKPRRIVRFGSSICVIINQRLDSPTGAGGDEDGDYEVDKDQYWDRIEEDEWLNECGVMIVNQFSDNRDVAAKYELFLLITATPIAALKHFGPWHHCRRLVGHEVAPTEHLQHYWREGFISPIVFGLTVMICDGHLEVGQKSSATSRFWRIVMRLPMELQKIVALRVGQKPGTSLHLSEFAWQLVAAMTAIPPPKAH